ncbi:MAG: hypothetical protein UY92_C0021G0001 [Candidatus Magasanikbacteria bacterium GW2011_GWA2_56_11]|uniref:Uncharacterized protein n=1 Tax=Candidatus Magasanikbacteria bacterium GW2011_GWA2_56_11 TaxID=1619044 RepID=A0A0G2AJG1_9BACT|nr:MAG: hypothetical protein UY92_C0021G0001 [Candidatus Magasanikbacteria bacterium GW2011_GWA2_56_11]
MRQQLSPLHHYQLGIVFLFVFSFCLFVAYLLVLENNNLDQRAWGWYFIVPWTAIYSAYCLRLRNRVTPAERVSPLKRPLGHWIVLGLSIIYFNAVKDLGWEIIIQAYYFMLIPVTNKLLILVMTISLSSV